MTKRGKYALIHGLINLALPFLTVLLCSVLGMTTDYYSNYTEFSYFYLAVFLVALPFASTLIGTLVTGVMLLKAPDRYVRFGLLLSAAGFIIQFLLRFVLK